MMLWLDFHMFFTMLAGKQYTFLTILAGKGCVFLKKSWNSDIFDLWQPCYSVIGTRVLF